MALKSNDVCMVRFAVLWSNKPHHGIWNFLKRRQHFLAIVTNKPVLLMSYDWFCGPRPHIMKIWLFAVEVEMPLTSSARQDALWSTGVGLWSWNCLSRSWICMKGHYIWIIINKNNIRMLYIISSFTHFHKIAEAPLTEDLPEENHVFFVISIWMQLGGEEG